MECAESGNGRRRELIGGKRESSRRGFHNGAAGCSRYKYLSRRGSRGCWRSKWRVRDGAPRGGFRNNNGTYTRSCVCVNARASSGVPLLVESPLRALERQKPPWPTSARMSSPCGRSFVGKFAGPYARPSPLFLSRPFRGFLAGTFIGTGNESFSAALAVIVVNTAFRRSLI